MSRIDTLPGAGPVLSLRQALYRAGRDYPGGITALAYDMGIDIDALQKKLKHDEERRWLSPEPVRDDAACENLRWLISFLCNHDEEALGWLTKWLAYPLQNMGAKMDTAVLMHSIMEGSGKSLLFADIFGQLYGQYAATVGQTQLEGSFNAWQSRKLWAVFEEVVSRDQRYNQVGKIKHMITGKTVRMESKFINGWPWAYSDHRPRQLRRLQRSAVR